MIQILLVEDRQDGMWNAIDWIASGQEIWEKFSPAVDLEIWKFNLHIVTCMRDAALWIRDNLKGELITILDGQFPRFSDSREDEVLYWEVILNLQNARDPAKNYLIPFSSYTDHNKGMVDKFLQRHERNNLLSEGWKNRETVQDAIKKFLTVKN